MQIRTCFGGIIKRVLFCGLLVAQANARESTLGRLDEILNDLHKYEFGESEEWKPELLESMRSIYRDPGLQRKAEALMLNFLKSDASRSAKLAIRREFSSIAGEASQGELLKWFDAHDNEGYMQTLEAQGTVESALELIAQSGSDTDSEIALLDAAENLAETQRTDEAITILKHLSLTSNDTMIQVAALRGRFQLSPQKDGFLVRNLKTTKPELRHHLIRLAGELPADSTHGIELLQLDGLSWQESIQLLKILAHRGDTSIHPIAGKYARSPDPDLRFAALEALALIGRREDILYLVELAATTDGKERELAQSALYGIPGKEVDEWMESLLPTVPANQQIELIKAVAERNMGPASDTLVKLAETGSEKVGTEALRTLGKIAPASILDPLVDWLIQANGTKINKEWGRTISRIAMRQSDPSEAIRILRNRLKGLTDDQSREALQSILANLEKANP